METPFAYGRIATKKNFIDREVEMANLVQNFTSLINIIIIAPRGWGKSSLVNKVGEISCQDPIYAYWLKTEYFRFQNLLYICEADFYFLADNKFCL